LEQGVAPFFMSIPQHPLNRRKY